MLVVVPAGRSADYDCVRSLRPVGQPPPPLPGLRDRLRSLGIWAPSRSRGWGPNMRQLVRRGRSAGAHRLTPVCAPPTAAEIVMSAKTSTITTTPTATSCCKLRDRLSFGCRNIRSLNDKLDHLLEVRRYMAIDLMCLVETWHEVDSINFSHLRMGG
jgi:hypothetical protein